MDEAEREIDKVTNNLNQNNADIEILKEQKKNMRHLRNSNGSSNDYHIYN